METALLVVLLLVFLIVVHELGHFIAAKIFGVRVEEFGVGYPPRAFLLGKIGATEYTLNWIPFGGFVRLYGEGETRTPEKDAYVNAARYKKAIILAAGVVMNVLAAWILFAGALSLQSLRAIDAPIPGTPSELIVSDVITGSPADAAGIRSNDQIVSIVDSYGVAPADLSPDSVVHYIGTHGGQPLSITFVHNHATSSAIVRPANAVIPNAEGRPGIGLALVLVTHQSLPFSQALIDALSSTRYAFETTAAGLWSIFSTGSHGLPNLTGVVGPVGLFGVVNDAAQNGSGNMLALAGFIAVNLAIVNLLPIPVLDGGKILILILEAVTRRNAPEIAVRLLNAIGVALIVALMITVTYHDIVRLVA